MDGRRPGLFNIVPSEPVIWSCPWDGNTEAGSLIPKDAHFRGRWSVDPTLSACLSRWSGWGRSNGVRGSTPALQPTPPVLERAWPRLTLYFVRGSRDPAWPSERGGRMVGACSRGECRISNCSFQSGVEETNVMGSDEISTSMPSDAGVARCSRICLERRRRVGVARGPQTASTDLGCPFRC